MGSPSFVFLIDKGGTKAVTKEEYIGGSFTISGDVVLPVGIGGGAEASILPNVPQGKEGPDLKKGGIRVGTPGAGISGYGNTTIDIGK